MTPNILLPKLKLQKISDLAYDLLQERIVSSVFEPGQRLDLNAVAKQLGISRIPIKEALTRLQLEGLVEIVPRSGTFVANPSRKEISDIFDLRRVLEVYAMEQAVQNVTDEDLYRLRDFVHQLGALVVSPQRDALYPKYTALDLEFHRELVALSLNGAVQEAYKRVNVHAQMARIRYKTAERELDLAQEEHERIIAALESRDVKTLVSEMDQHLRRAKTSFMADLDAALANEDRKVPIPKWTSAET